ncbi:DUF6766 family protein [Jiangella gansuensis]|uniref:DUF6766 family protein n=1 Tax=Jiangella gansuensis TaxID=281473 RepID=UPI0004B42EE0|nr:DUF6766 family protein [Jiangella gansuensis]
MAGPVPDSAGAVSNDQQAHGEPFAWSDYFATFFSSTFENWQSEWLQLVFQAVLLLAAKHLIFQADAEDLERIERKIDNIHEHVGAGEVGPEKGDDAAIRPERST